MASLVTTNDNNDAPDAIVVEAILVKDTFYTFIGLNLLNFNINYIILKVVL